MTSLNYPSSCPFHSNTLVNEIWCHKTTCNPLGAWRHLWLPLKCGWNLQDYFSGRLASLKAAFPEDYILNAMALKANSLRGILSLAAAKGFGAECASISEVVHALSLKFPPQNVVFDSPVKTRLKFEITWFGKPV